MMLQKVIFVLVILFAFSFHFVIENTPYPFKPLYNFPAKPQNITNIVTNEGAVLGRYLFYDTILSKDYSLSCASCHKQKYAFADNARFSKGFQSELMPRNTLALFNLAWYNRYFWDGRVASIESQVFVPVAAHNEMNLSWIEAEKRLNNSRFYKKMFKKTFGIQRIDSIHIAKAIGQFERTLISATSKYDRVLQGKERFTEDELEGFVLLNDQSMADCLHCHITDATSLGTNGKFSNNGLDKEPTDLGMYSHTGQKKDIGKFKIPSLRNIALTAPYMHDGRFATLEEVVDFYSSVVQPSEYTDSKMQYAHQGGVRLSKKEKKQIIAFLHTLTDSAFISNPEFSNPFIP